MQRNLDQILAEFERNMIAHTLRDMRGNQSRAARALGISKRKIQYKIRKYGIDCKIFKVSHSTEPELLYPWLPYEDTDKDDHDDFHSLLLS